MRRTFVALALTTLQLAVAARAAADKPEQPPAGMGKYFLFLKVPPPVPPGQERKKIKEPDIAKLGGRILQRADGYLIMYLPKEAVQHLRGDDNVDFVQRIWVGESLEDWGQTSSSSSSTSADRGLVTNSDADGPTWGPKEY